MKIYLKRKFNVNKFDTRESLASGSAHFRTTLKLICTESAFNQRKIMNKCVYVLLFLQELSFTNYCICSADVPVKAEIHI